MSQATTRASAPVSNAAQDPPPSKDLRGLMPYLRRYTGSIVIGLLMVFLMGVVTNVLPLATGIMTDTLAGSPSPFENSSGKKPALAAAPPVSMLIRAIPYYPPNNRHTLRIYLLIVDLCLALHADLSFS